MRFSNARRPPRCSCLPSLPTLRLRISTRYSTARQARNRTIQRCVWCATIGALEGKPEKTIIISRNNAYHGSTVAGASLGGMRHMHKQMGGMVPDIVHVMEPYAYELGPAGRKR